MEQKQNATVVSMKMQQLKKDSMFYGTLYAHETILTQRKTKTIHPHNDMIVELSIEMYLVVTLLNYISFVHQPSL